MTEQTNNLNRIEAIEGLASLLYYGKEKENPVTEWFSRWENNKERLLDSYEVNVDHRITSDMLFELRECLLSQQWAKALQILPSLSKVPYSPSETIWRCGLELIGQDEEHNNHDLVRKLYNEIKYLHDMNYNEVMLDYLLFLMMKDDVETAKELLQEKLVKKGARPKAPTDRDLYMSSLSKAYSGLVWYLKWKHCYRDIEELRTREEQQIGSQMMSSSQSSSVLLQMQMTTYAQKALTCFDTLAGVSGVWDIFIKKHVEMTTYAQKALTWFDSLAGVSGVWDIFITKHVELLVYSEKIEDALSVLTDYKNVNPDNPNAVRYLYHFYTEHYPDSENIHTLLEEIVRILPADPLVLEYCSQVNEGNESVILPQLFKLLGYACWQNEVQPWKMLANCLQKMAVRSAEDLSTIKSCWDSCRSWWPKFHFNKHVLVYNDAQFGVNFYKTVVAGLLCGSENEFVKEVSRKLLREELDELDKVLEHYHGGLT